jgi:hypothetical protein
MRVFIGVIFHFMSGFASGSFYTPYKKVMGWHWESFWFVGGLFSRSFISTSLADHFTVPSFAGIIHKNSSAVQRRHNLYKFDSCVLNNVYETLLLPTNNNELK